MADKKVPYRPVPKWIGMDTDTSKRNKGEAPDLEILLKWIDSRNVAPDGDIPDGPGGQERKLQWANLPAANLNGANLKHVNLSSAFLQGADLRNAILIDTTLIGADLCGVDLQNTDLSKANFGGAVKLGGAKLNGAIITKQKFGTSNLSRADFTEAKLTGSDLMKADIHQVKISRADFEQVQLPSSLNNFYSALDNIEKVSKNASKIFTGLNIIAIYILISILKTDQHFVLNSAEIKLPLVGTSVSIVDFFWISPVLALLTFIYFHSYYRHCCELVAELPRTFPDGLLLSKKVYPWLPNIIMQQWQGPTKWEKEASYNIRTWSWWRAWIVKIWLFCFVPGIVLMTYLKILGTQMADPTYASAILFILIAIASLLFYSTDKVVLAGEEWNISLLPRNFTRVVVAVCLLVGVGAIWGPEGKFSLSQPNLKNLNLSVRDTGLGPNFRGASLINADLSNSVLDGGNFNGAEMMGADLSNSHVENAKFQWTNLEGANLQNTNLSGAHFTNANLENASFSYATLKGTIFSASNMQGVNFRGANLEGVSFIHSNILGAKGLHPERLCKAEVWAKGLLPGDEGALMCLKRMNQKIVADVQNFKFGKDTVRDKTEKECPSGSDYREGWPGKMMIVGTKPPSEVLILCSELE